MTPFHTNPVLVALDVPTREAALNLTSELRPHVGGFKVGLELFCSVGGHL
jgi:orotidine-5'-phosphate decarboxylase